MPSSLHRIGLCRQRLPENQDPIPGRIGGDGDAVEEPGGVASTDPSPDPGCGEFEEQSVETAAAFVVLSTEPSCSNRLDRCPTARVVRVTPTASFHIDTPRRIWVGRL